MPADFYELLGVDDDDASQGEVKRAFRERARQFHPDVNDHPRAAEQFKTLNTAYEVLSSSKERPRYDRLGHRSYVDQHLDGLPTMSVPDSVGEEGAGTETGERAEGATGSDRASGGSATTDHSTATGSSRTEESAAGSSGVRESTDGSATRSATGSDDRTSTSGTSHSDGARNASHGSGRSSGSAGTASTDTSADGTTSSTSTSSRSTSSTSNSSQSTSSTSTTTTASSNGASSRTSTSGGAGESGTGRNRTASGGRATAAGSRETGSHRTGLRRGWIATILALSVFLSGVGSLLAEEDAALVDALSAEPIDGLAGASPLADPIGTVVSGAEFVVAGGAGSVPDGPLALAFGAGVVGLPLVVGVTVWRYGRGTAYLYPLATTAPLLWIVCRPFASTPLAADLLLLVVVPVGAALTFVGDIGRYLFAS